MADAEPTTPIGRAGRVVAAKQPRKVGFHIAVQDDREGSTGGLYVLTWRDDEHYDAWIETVDDLDTYFAHAGYDVEWLTR